MVNPFLKGFADRSGDYPPGAGGGSPGGGLCRKDSSVMARDSRGRGPY
jgi:hypothetical protein